MSRHDEDENALTIYRNAGHVSSDPANPSALGPDLTIPALTRDLWPNCSVPDCEYKSCRSLHSDKCFAHTQGRNPEMSFAEYMRRGVTKL